jgi:hypothetical protein
MTTLSPEANSSEFLTNSMAGGCGLDFRADDAGLDAPEEVEPADDARVGGQAVDGLGGLRLESWRAVVPLEEWATRARLPSCPAMRQAE